MVHIAQTLDDASIALDGHNVLNPKHPNFEHYYVKRQEGAGRVEKEHVERIWNEQTGFFRRVLKKADYEVLRQVEKDPYPEGLDGIPPLLHLKAIIFYPNGEGWYGVHPAVQRLLGGS